MTKWSMFVTSVKTGYAVYKALMMTLSKIDWSLVNQPLKITVTREVNIE